MLCRFDGEGAGVAGAGESVESRVLRISQQGLVFCAFDRLTDGDRQYSLWSIFFRFCFSGILFRFLFSFLMHSFVILHPFSHKENMQFIFVVRWED